MISICGVSTLLFFKFNDYNSIDRFIIINEYSKIDTTNKINFLKEKFPQVDFIQKKRNEKGQANSLNIIINILRENNYDYWIQWEESWFPNRNFIKDAIEIMSESNIDQLQFTNDWFNWVEKEAGYLSLPKWNFYKYLISKDGKLSSWFSSVTKPSSEKLLNELKKIM